MTGATTYQLANILTLFLLTALIKLKESRNNRQKTTYFILSALLLFMAIGCNEIMLLMVDLMLLTIISIDYFKTRKANYTLLALLVIAFGFSIIVFLAPGNNVRVTHNDDSHLLIPAILATLKRTISQIIFRLIWSPLLIFSIVFIPLFNRIARLMIRDNNPIFKVHPLIALGWMILLPMFLFVLHYNLSPHEPHCERIVTMLFLFFILALFYFEILLLVHIKRKQLFNTGFIKIHSAVWFILLLFYVLVPFREHNQIRVAYTDLISGKSYKNNKQMTERFEYLKNSDCTHCTVPEITVRPETIYYIWFSLSENKKFWMNREQAIYFKKSSVAVGVEETKATGQ
jgi:hypothetical protein